MNLTEKQKKAAWIAGAFLVALHFAPGFIRTIVLAHQRPVARAVAPPTLTPVAVAPAAPVSDPQFAVLAGKWTGRFLVSNFACDTTLELKPSASTANDFTAYTTMGCIPLDITRTKTPTADWMQNLIRAGTPASAIFNGKVEGPSIQVHLTQAIGKQDVGCQPTDYTLTPFGDSQLAVKWDNAPCEQGQMVMTRAPR